MRGLRPSASACDSRIPTYFTRRAKTDGSCFASYGVHLPFTTAAVALDMSRLYRKRKHPFSCRTYVRWCHLAYPLYAGWYNGSLWHTPLWTPAVMMYFRPNPSQGLRNGSQLGRVEIKTTSMINPRIIQPSLRALPFYLPTLVQYVTP